VRTLAVAFSLGLVILAGCNAGEAPASVDGTRPSGVAESRVAESEKDAGIFLRSVPEACDYLSEAQARELLQANVVFRPGAGNSCAYGDSAGSNKYVAVSMMKWGLDMFDSRRESMDSLTEKASFLADNDTPVETRDDIGNVAFVFNKDDNTSLISLTGIGGTAAISDRIVSELSVSYHLQDSAQTHEARLEQVLPLAANAVENLREIAATTHEGRASPL
jgi:hypothetical protein